MVRFPLWVIFGLDEAFGLQVSSRAHLEWLFLSMHEKHVAISSRLNLAESPLGSMKLEVFVALIYVFDSPMKVQV